MASDEPVDRPVGLASFTRDAIAELDARAIGVRPDFAAMMACARALTAEVAARTPAPVIPLVAGDADDAPAAPHGVAQRDPLMPFTAALRAALDAKVQERALAGVPPPRASARRGRRGVLVVLAAAAATLLLTVGGARVLRIDRHDRGLAASAAVDRRADSTSLPAPAMTTGTHPSRPRPSVPEVSADAGAPAPDDPTARSPVPGDSLPVGPPTPPAQALTAPEPEPAARRPRAAPTHRRRSAPAGPSAPMLEEEAQQLWERGELAAAEQKFREVVRVAHDSRRAELAYGDLFVLARQIRGADGQTGVWREYLERFPRGRFADDARGGLCQRATGDESTACWRAYLSHHPDGAHRGQATAALEGAP